MTQHRDEPFMEFEAWVAYVFDHEPTSPEWYWDFHNPPLEPCPEIAVDLLHALFAAPEQPLARYTDAQVNQGLWYVMGEGSTYAHALFDPSVPRPEREACLRAIPRLYEHLFAARCTPHLSHMDEPGLGPLNSICYMWWDVFPTWGNPETGEMDTVILDVMEEILQLDAIACQEAALHGLSHWRRHYQQRTAQAITRFLDARPNLRPELRQYALQAQGGCVQ